jgi:hypothetical protein
MAVQTRHRAIPLLLAAVLATACGSTVQGSVTTQAGPTTPVGGDGLGGAAPSPASGAGPGDATGGSFVVGPTGTATQAPIWSGTTGGTTGSATPGGVGNMTNAPGVTAKEVYVGLIYDENAGAVNSAAGIGSITSGDSKANTRAILNDINTHGGVAGRKLVAVYAKFDSTSTQTLTQQYAAICQQFTHDSPRVFVAEGAVGDEAYRQCLSKAGVGILSDSLPTLGQAELMRSPGLIEQGYPNVDRLAAYHVTPLVEQHYFTPWDSLNGQPAATGTVKVGILTYNDQVFSKAVDRYLVPALKRLGYDPQVERIAQINTTADYSSQGAAVKAAQLSFAANGVTHVIPFEANGGLSTLFLPTARSQHYYPRYGMSTASAFQALMDTGIVESKQMTGAVGFGWIPSVDLHASYNPDNGPYSNANRRHCLKVMKDNGITFTSGNAQVIALNTCATLYLLRRALDLTPAHIAASTFISAVESLGTSYENPSGLGQDFRPGRHDPSNKAYHWRYFPDCTCLHYEGPLQTVP